MSTNFISIGKKTFLIILILFSTILFKILFSDKPELLENISFGTLVVDSNNNLLHASLSRDEKYRIRIPLEEINPYAIKCLIQYEDKMFYKHPGINVLSIIRAFFQYPFTGRLSGASTISMQLARMLFRLKTSNLSGKLKQIWFALILERHYNKEELLEAFFNLAPYGSNIEGIEAASRIYFHKSAHKLTESECAALTIIPQNPVKRNPYQGRDFKKTYTRFSSTLNAEIKPNLKIYGFENLPFLAPHLSRQLEGSHNGKGGIIHTGIDGVLQKDLERLLLNYVQRGKRYEINNASAIIIDCRNMMTVAYAGSANFFDKSIQGQVDGIRARRSPGSTLKPFIYALALEQGLIHPMSILPDSPGSYGLYTPENFDHTFRGPVSAKEALKTSRNLPAIWLNERINSPDFYNFLLSAQVKFKYSSDHYGLALTLGGAEVNMKELACLYAMLANKGIWKNLRFSKNDPHSAGKRLLSPESAWITMQMLREEEFAAGPKKIPVYAKTGTSNGLRDAWTAGICGKYVVIVWVGNFDNRSNPYFVGAKSAMPLFEEIITDLAYQKKLKNYFSERPENVSDATVCLNTGDIYTGQCENTDKTYFIPGKSPVRKSGILRPVFIDRKTGLRDCEYKEGKTDQIWWEFWPSDMKKIFAQAGINKPDPPDFLKECDKKQLKGKGNAPEIKFPKKQVFYHRFMADKNFQIPLMASADPDTQVIHWYANSVYIGRSRPEETILWKPGRGGEIYISAVDNQGRSSRRKCVILSTPEKRGR